MDQTAGDASISGALSSLETFDEMLHACIVENVDAKILIKTHPDVFLGKKKSCFSKKTLAEAEAEAKSNGVKFVDSSLTNKELFEQVDEIHTVSSQLGFEALWYEKKVVCYGVPFYAGYGLTEDKKQAIRSRKQIDLETLCFHALLSYCQYIDPETKEKCTLEELLPLLVEQKRARFAKGPVVGLDFSFWKRCFLPFWMQSNPITFNKLGLKYKPRAEQQVLVCVLNF